MTIDKLLTAKDLQRIFGCGKNRAYELMHTAGFPALQIAGRFYVKQSAFDRWLDRYSGCTFCLQAS